MDRSAFRRFWTDESGATAIEYALLVGLMAVCVAAIAATGGAVEAMYGKVNDVSDAID